MEGEVGVVKGLKLGYIRVSTEEQNTARQEEIMKKEGVDKIFMEKASGKNMNREQLIALLAYAREGDLIVVESWSRLSRSFKDLLEIVGTMQSKGIDFKSIKEGTDTTQPYGKFIFRVFASVYEFQRELNLENQKEGIAIAKAEGKYKGRKPMARPYGWEDVIKMVDDKEITKEEAARKLAMTHATFYRMLNEYRKEQICKEFI